MRKNLNKIVLTAVIAMSCMLILSIIGCASASTSATNLTNKSTFYKTTENEVCTYKVLGEKVGNAIKYEHYDKTCTEYGSNVVKIIGENMSKQEK